MFTLNIPIQHYTRTLSQRNKARKRNKRQIDWKERKLFFTDDIVYIQNLKNSKKKKNPYVTNK